MVNITGAHFFENKYFNAEFGTKDKGNFIDNFQLECHLFLLYIYKIQYLMGLRIG